MISTSEEQSAGKEIEFDRSLLGVKHEGRPVLVTEEMIRRLCASVGETNPLFIDRQAAREAGHADIIAPPTICNVLVGAMPRPDPKVEFGDVLLQGGQLVESLAPVTAGDTLTGSVYLKEVYRKTGRSGTMVFIVWESEFVNQDGKLVGRVQESWVRRNRGGE